MNIWTKYEKDPSNEKKVTAQFIVSFYGSHTEQTAKSSADDLEDIGEGQKLFYMTRFLFMVNICTKFENPSNGKKVTALSDMAKSWVLNMQDKLAPIFHDEDLNYLHHLRVNK